MAVDASEYARVALVSAPGRKRWASAQALTVGACVVGATGAAGVAAWDVTEQMLETLLDLVARFHQHVRPPKADEELAY